VKILAATANLGNFEAPSDSFVPQTVPNVDLHAFTDDNFPPIADMGPRAQYRICKTFTWQMVPDYDFYIWFDGSCAMDNPDSVKWYLEQLGEHDIAMFKHPWRKTIREENDYIEYRMNHDDNYLIDRYGNGLHKEQMAEIDADDYTDDVLYATTSFVYRNTPKVQEALKLVWYHISRYYTCDQLGWTYALWKAGLDIKVIPNNVFKMPYLTYLRAPYQK